MIALIIAIEINFCNIQFMFSRYLYQILIIFENVNVTAKRIRISTKNFFNNLEAF